jgi:hypothetical protein
MLVTLRYRPPLDIPVRAYSECLLVGQVGVRVCTTVSDCDFPSCVVFDNVVNATLLRR